MNEGDERLAFLEGRVEEQAMRIDDVRDALVSLEQRIDRRLESFEQRMDAFERRMDQRFAMIDQRFAGIDQRLDSIDARFGRIYALLIAMLVAIVGGMGGIIAAILRH